MLSAMIILSISRARTIKISSDSELESDVDGDKSDNLPVEIKVLGQHIEVFTTERVEDRNKFVFH